MSAEDFFGFNNILFYGNSKTFLRLVVENILQVVLNNGNKIRSTTTSFEEIEIFVSNFHVEIDFQTCSSEKTIISNYLATHLTLSKNINQQKHSVVLHNVHELSQQSMFALRKVLEAKSKHVMFLMTCQNLSSVNEAIKSRCSLIRCNVPKENIDGFLDAFMEDHDVEEFEYDATKCLLTNLVQNKENRFEFKTNHFLDELKKISDFKKAMQYIRGFSYDILKYQIPLASIFKIVLNRYTDISLIKLAASLETRNLKMAKPFLALERFLVEVYKHNK
jgi:hypothetical protein